MFEIKMKKMEYHDFIDCDWAEIENLFKYHFINYGLKKGDLPCFDINSSYFSPVLVLNDDNFLDCEYRFKLDFKIYTLEETKKILKTLKN